MSFAEGTDSLPLTRSHVQARHSQAQRRTLVGLAVAICAAVAGPNQPAAQSAAPTSANNATEQQSPAGELPRRVVIRFLTDTDYPPFNFLDEEGVLTGFNIDLARAICLEAGATCDIKPAPWDEMIPALTRGEADALIAGHAVLPSQVGKIEYSDRYFFMAARFAARKGSSIAHATPEGLEGKRVAVVKGSAHEAYLRTFFRDTGIVPFDTAETARDALTEGKVDALFDDGVSLAFWLNGTNSKACCEFKGGPFLEPRFFGDGMAMVLPKKDQQIRKLINAALKRVRESGRLEELVARYFPYRIF